jgi:hypothetical protein
MKHKLFLDSGAFSAFQNKTDVNIQNYIRFIKDHLHEIETYANLDSIGNVEETWTNQAIMENEGLKPIPVYHLDEDPKYLDRCLKYDYFAVGGLASATGRALDPFLIDVFRKVCPKENNYYPISKVHGFGIATPQMVSKFPWYSLDTTSWVQYSRYGIILLPFISEQVPKYNKPPQTIAVSSRSKAIGDAEHLNNYEEDRRKTIIAYIKYKGFSLGHSEIIKVPLGYKLKPNEFWINKNSKKSIERIVERGLCNDGDLRTSFNLEFFLELEKNQPVYPWRFVHERTVEQVAKEKREKRLEKLQK